MNHRLKKHPAGTPEGAQDTAGAPPEAAQGDGGTHPQGNPERAGGPEPADVTQTGEVSRIRDGLRSETGPWEVAVDGNA